MFTKKTWLTMITLVAMFGLLLASCAPKATETPVVTEKPAAEQPASGDSTGSNHPNKSEYWLHLLRSIR